MDFFNEAVRARLRRAGGAWVLLQVLAEDPAVKPHKSAAAEGLGGARFRDAVAAVAGVELAKRGSSDFVARLEPPAAVQDRHCRHCRGLAAAECACRSGCVRPQHALCMSHCEHCAGLPGACPCPVGCAKPAQARCSKHCRHCRGIAGPCACADCPRAARAQCWRQATIEAVEEIARTRARADAAEAELAATDARLASAAAELSQLRTRLVLVEAPAAERHAALRALGEDELRAHVHKVLDALTAAQQEESVRNAVDAEFKCVVCCDRPRRALLLPCKHMCLCVVCCAEVRAKVPPLCPLCRAAIADSIVAFV